MVPRTHRVYSLSHGISIGSAVSVQFISVANTQTDTQTTLCVTSVAIGRICYACNAAYYYYY